MRFHAPQVSLTLDTVSPGYSLAGASGQPLTFRGFLRSKAPETAHAGAAVVVNNTYTEFRFSDMDAATSGAQEFQVENLEDIKQVRAVVRYHAREQVISSR